MPLGTDSMMWSSFWYCAGQQQFISVVKNGYLAKARIASHSLQSANHLICMANFYEARTMTGAPLWRDTFRNFFYCLLIKRILGFTLFENYPEKSHFHPIMFLWLHFTLLSFGILLLIRLILSFGISISIVGFSLWALESLLFDSWVNSWVQKFLMWWDFLRFSNTVDVRSWSWTQWRGDRETLWPSPPLHCGLKYASHKWPWATLKGNKSSLVCNKKSLL